MCLWFVGFVCFTRLIVLVKFLVGVWWFDVVECVYGLLLWMV